MSRRLKTPLIIIVGVLLGGGFYFLLIDTTSLPELYVLAGVAIACAVAFQLAREQDFVEARVLPQWLLSGWRLVWQIPRDIALVCAEALAQLVRPKRTRGVFRAVPFEATAHTPDDTGRRALVESVGSFAPNTIVVGVDDERGMLLVHQLRRHGAPDELDVARLG